MDDTKTPFEALEAAVARVGSQTGLARICGVSQPAVWKWLKTSKRLPPEHCIAVEAQTGVSRHNLRPDIYPLEPTSNGVPDQIRNISCDRTGISHRMVRA
ncbi:transcriptional regulator [Sphingomonas sp. CFBP 8765]|uniref:transcriptional regulator n=1 Tax=Sphingomonas sp. CFBP 8765 TaxID=2775274 RepID=UPI001784C392|nr:helix-turn-helix domain-containing protein [Sphingomonas sp. CFBP 8765]MBD8469179.1 helix-turn-helix domain-containing protein [Sphingomonas sp. CFBP 8765]